CATSPGRRSRWTAARPTSADAAPSRADFPRLRATPVKRGRDNSQYPVSRRTRGSPVAADHPRTPSPACPKHHLPPRRPVKGVRPMKVDKIGHLAAGVLAVALVTASCSSERSGTDGVSGENDSGGAAASSKTFGTLPSPCGPGDAKGKTDQ